MRSNSSVWALTVPVLFLVALLASGCAGSVGSAKPLIEAPGPEALARYTKVAFKTSAEGNASKMTVSDRERRRACGAKGEGTGTQPFHRFDFDGNGRRDTARDHRVYAL